MDFVVRDGVRAKDYSFNSLHAFCVNLGADPEHNPAKHRT